MLLLVIDPGSTPPSGADDRALAIANVRQNEQNSQNRNSARLCQFCPKIFVFRNDELWF